MLKVLRRSRLLAALLFAASPAIGGTVLPAIHPCPVDMPWLAQTSGEHAGHGQHAGHSSSGSQHDACNCIGSWLTGTAVAAPKPAGLSSPVVTLFSPIVLSGTDSSLDLTPRAALLPPATAPPLL
jgi:hypothetical protein